MPSDPNWPRWLYASASKFFYDRRGETNFFIEGQERSSSAAIDLIEFRLDGPNIVEVNKNYWLLDVDINLLVQCVKNGADYHRTHRICGLVAQAFTSIPVFKFGDSIDDDQSFIGCLELAKGAGKQSGIKITHFGQIGPDTPLMQSCVEGHFEMALTTT